jgi:septal ring factor EnvC (AmiA/AmiB activator)
VKPSTPLLLILLPALAMAAPPAGDATQAPKQDLKDVRQQINALEKEVKAKEANRAEATDALRASEVAISEANRALASLNEQQSHSEQQLAKVRANIQQAQRDVAVSRKRLGRILNAQYRHGQNDALTVLLNQQDPNQTQRDLAYYRKIAQAQQQVGQQLKTQLAELERLSGQLETEKAKLDDIAASRVEHKQKLVKEKENRQQVVSQLSNQIQQQRQQLGKLQADEQRINALIDKINRELEAQRREAARKAEEARKLAQAKHEQAVREAKAKAEREAKAQREAAEREAKARHARDLAAAQAAAKAGKPAPPPEPAPPPPPPPKAEPKAEPPAKAVDDVADDSSSGRAFASLQGKLRLPVRGEITGRFGAARAEGMTWKGVFIRAGGGQPVRAVADGRVVYADWLRGFGNMLIVDHGGGYMTVYGSGEALMKSTGDKVRAGDTVATTGASGGGSETGLYFEIRHLGRPLNPLSWAQS